MSEATKKPRVHKSMLKMFAKCPVQYQYRYCEGIIAPPGIALLIGTGTHIAVAKDLTSKRDTGKLLPDEAVADAARDGINHAWDKDGAALNESEQLLGEKRARGEAVDMAVRLAGVHHKDLAPKITPTQIERPFVVELKGFPVDLGGTIDLQEPGGVRDLKTSAKATSQVDADSSLDLTTYGLAAKALDGVAPTSLSLDVLVKTKTPYALTLPTVRGDAQYRSFLLRVEAMADAVAKGAFSPCDPSCWWCSRRFCGYFDRCPYGVAARVTV
jgi:RecB family exonuclease